MGYIHVETLTSQLSKKPGKPCGDVVFCDRKPNATTIILCDGLGSGIKANIYATMYASRIQELLAREFSLRKTFSHLVKTINEAAKNDYPWVAFSICRILNNGFATILSYEMPPPILIAGKYPVVLKQNQTTVENSIITEVNYTLRTGESFLLMSDGVAQSGMGTFFTHGWGVDGVKDFISEQLKSGKNIKEIPELIKSQAYNYYGLIPRDDITALLIKIRKGTVVNIFTGPPADNEKDETVVKKFLKQPGYKIISGGTTAKVVSRVCGKRLSIEDNFENPLTPPKYFIDGIDLVTEGAVTLNQVYNILNADTKKIDKRSPVAQLYYFLFAADCINFIVGTSLNKANEDISFTQLGILPRHKIISLLADDLRKMGKLVTVEYD